MSSIRLASIVLLVSLFASRALGLSVKEVRIEDYEGRQIVGVELVFEGSRTFPTVQAEFMTLLRVAPNTPFSAIRVRDSLQALFDSGRVANARVEVIEEGTPRTGPVRLRFVVQRQIQISDVRIEIAPETGEPLSADEIRARLNFLQPGTRVTKQLIERNADEIQVYLRDRGYFNAAVEPVEELDRSGVRAAVTYRVNPGAQARVDAFDIQITGFTVSPAVRNSLQLQPGTPFTRDALGSDVKKIRDALVAQQFLAPSLEDARVERDAEKNVVRILVKGAQ